MDYSKHCPRHLITSTMATIIVAKFEMLPFLSLVPRRVDPSCHALWILKSQFFWIFLNFLWILKNQIFFVKISKSQMCSPHRVLQDDVRYSKWEHLKGHQKRSWKTGKIWNFRKTAKTTLRPVLNFSHPFTKIKRVTTKSNICCREVAESFNNSI